MKVKGKFDQKVLKQLGIDLPPVQKPSLDGSLSSHGASSKKDTKGSNGGYARFKPGSKLPGNNRLKSQSQESKQDRVGRSEARVTRPDGRNLTMNAGSSLKGSVKSTQPRPSKHVSPKGSQRMDIKN